MDSEDRGDLGRKLGSNVTVEASSSIHVDD